MNIINSAQNLLGLQSSSTYEIASKVGPVYPLKIVRIL